MKLFRLMYLGRHDEARFIKAESMTQALQYALRKDIKGTNAFGDVMCWGEVDRIELWESEWPIIHNEPYEVATFLDYSS